MENWVLQRIHSNLSAVFCYDVVMKRREVATMAKSGLDCSRMGQNIRRMRLNQKWTQKDLAARAALSVSQLSRLERGDGGMSVETFFRLCNALACKPADMLEKAE